MHSLSDSLSACLMKQHLTMLTSSWMQLVASLSPTSQLAAICMLMTWNSVPLSAVISENAVTNSLSYVYLYIYFKCISFPEKFLLKIHVCTYFSFVPFSSSLAEASFIHIFFASPLSRYGLVTQEAQRAKPHTCPGAAKGSIIPSWLPPPGAALSTCLDWYSDIDCGPAGVQAQRAVWRARWAAGPPHGDEMVQQHCCSRRWWNQSKSRLPRPNERYPEEAAAEIAFGLGGAR